MPVHFLWINACEALTVIKIKLVNINVLVTNTIINVIIINDTNNNVKLSRIFTILQDNFIRLINYNTFF